MERVVYLPLSPTMSASSVAGLAATLRGYFAQEEPDVPPTIPAPRSVPASAHARDRVRPVAPARADDAHRIAARP
jgi:hypothetical protein